MVSVVGAESAIRPVSLQREGAPGPRHQVPVRSGNDAETVGGEALGDECSEGNGTNGVLSNDIQDKMELRVGTTLTFGRYNLILS